MAREMTDAGRYQTGADCQDNKGKQFEVFDFTVRILICGGTFPGIGRQPFSVYTEDGKASVRFAVNDFFMARVWSFTNIY
jgi:hypothetical protein